MLRLKLSLLLTCCSFSLFSTPTPLPQTLDYVKLAGKEAWTFGLKAFNNAPELTPFFLTLKRDYDIEVAVETGTSTGATTVSFSLIFDQVHTIEIVEDTFLRSQEALRPFSNVTCHLGSSDVVLSQILPALQNQRVLFYLDAHWQQYWPLLQELAEIGRTHKDNCIIVIDDFKVPNRKDIPYDAYGQDECSLRYVRQSLKQIFTDYTVHFIIPKSVHSRAKLVVIPTKWRSELSQ